MASCTYVGQPELSMGENVVNVGFCFSHCRAFEPIEDSCYVAFEVLHNYYPTVN